MPEKYGKIIKVIIVGNGGIGKTALCCAVTGKPVASSSEYLLTVGVDFHTLQLQVDGELVTLQVSDLAGQKQFESIIDLFVGGAEGAILAYDLTNMMSYTDLHATWIPFVQQYLPGAPMVLVGTKCDLSEREVTSDVVSEFLETKGKQLNIVAAFETSSFEKINIREPFQALVEAIVLQSKK